MASTSTEVGIERAVAIAGTAVEVAGVAALVLGALVACSLALRALLREGPASAYHALRQSLGRAILLGLELLVAADIIRTVSSSPTLDDVLVLALIVAIRTTLSFALQVELEGRWPWRRGGAPAPVVAERHAAAAPVHAAVSSVHAAPSPVHAGAPDAGR